MINTKAPFKASILATAILLTACGGDSSNSNNSSDNNHIGFSSQAEGNFTISAQGGNSASQMGGDGGVVSIKQTNSPAALNVLTAGTPDTSYQLPAVSVQLGNVPVTISEDTEVEVLNRISNSTETGTLYLVEGKNRLYQYDGDSELGARNTEVTGLVVNADTTLTLEANSGFNVAILFANDLVNNGTIATYVSSSQWSARSSRSSINLVPAAYSGSGSIETQGAHPGQSGGDIRISAQHISNSGDLLAQGEMGESSGDTEGGQGGSINLFSNTILENKGKLITSGGDSEKDIAGSAGSVTLRAEEVYNSGDITAEAGEGDNNIEPSANQAISLYAQEVLINTGDLSVNGSDSIEDSYATDAGSIYLSLESDYATRSTNRRLINSANLNANGGSTLTTNTVQTAGQGGYIEISAIGGKANGETDISESLVIISGNLSANGGDSSQGFEKDGEIITQGSNAGDAGNIVIEHISHLSHALPTYLSGYTTIQADGGEGLQAGDAGSVYISNDKAADEQTSLAGPITVEADISVDAGVSISSLSEDIPSAGIGGYVDISVISNQAYLQPSALTVAVTGDISANAGDVENGPRGSTQAIILSAPHAVSVNANISSNGSSDTEEEDTDELYNRGSDGGFIGFYSYEGSINFNGALSANGGSGLTEAGHAGGFSSVSSTTNLIAGSISLNGGNAEVKEEAEQDEDNLTRGGDAGVAYIHSDDYSAILTASVLAQAGSGEEPGREGGASVNADCQLGSCNDQHENLIY